MSAAGGRRQEGAARGHRTTGLLALLAGAAGLAAAAIAIRAAYRHDADPSSLVAVRMGLAGVPFALLLPWLLLRAASPLPWRGLGLALGAGAALSIGARCELEGLQRLPAAILILLLFAAPVWVVLIERVVWGRRPHPIVLAAIAATVAGLVTMVAPWSGGLNFVGVAFGLAGSLALATFFVLLDRSQATLTTTLAVSVALAVAGAGAILAHPGGLSSSLGDPAVRPYALAIAAATAGWGLLAAVGLRETDATTATIVGAAEPVFVALFAFLLLGETLAPRELAGGAVVIAGILFAALGPLWAERRRAPAPFSPPAVRPARGTARRRDRRTLRR